MAVWKRHVLTVPLCRKMRQSPSLRYDQSLAAISIFKGLEPAALSEFHRHCEWRCYEPGESIVDYLDTSNEVYFIIEGEARVCIISINGRRVSFRSLRPGDIFGEYAAIFPGRRSAGVEAHTKCVLAAMRAAVFRDVVRSDSAVMQALLEHFVKEIRELTARVYEFSTLAAGNRIQAEVLRLANLAPRKGKSACIVPAPTHAEIASRISSHREAVTRELNRLSRIGIIERQGGDLLVMDVDRLAAMVHEATGE